MRNNIITFLFVLSLFSFFSSYAFAGTILNSHKYAWSDNAGYINFESVVVNDDLLSGSAWSANKGLITFDPAEGGVLNDGTGDLSGWAWGEQLGWINFDNVMIDQNGRFSGTATGDLAGTITFDCPNYCDVETDWRESSIPGPGSSSNKSSSSRVIGNRLPKVEIPPANLNNVIIPSFPNTGSLVETNSPKALPIAVSDGGPASLIEALTEKSAFVDVASEPTQTRTESPFRAERKIFGFFQSEFLFYASIILLTSTVLFILGYILIKRRKY